MKRKMLALLLALLLTALTGCGAIVVEDSEPVRIGCNRCVEMFT